MNSPPGTSSPDLSPNPPANAESSFLHPKVIAREAAKVLNDLHLDIHPARLRLLVQRFVETGRGDVDFRTWFLAYADPTGEQAVRHVTKERGW